MEAGPGLRQGRPQILRPGRPDMQAAKKPWRSVGPVRNVATRLSIQCQWFTCISKQFQRVAIATRGKIRTTIPNQNGYPKDDKR